MDFGLAKKAGQTMLTKEGTTIGTISYMSPEQARGEDVDHRTDIWSLGVMLYEMILGRLPFKGDYEQAIVYSVMNEEPEPITSLRTGVPIQLEQYVNKCLAKDPEDRYPASDGLIVDLRQLTKDTSKVTPAAAKTATDSTIQTEQEKESSITPAVAPKSKKALIEFVLVVIALGVFAVWKFLPTEIPELIKNRVAVAYFKNETGDSSLDYLKRMAADHLTEGIGKVNFVEVAALVPENEIDATKQSSEQLNLLSEKTGANIIVSGVFYKEGNKLIFQPEVSNISTAKPLKTLQRITGELSDPSFILEELSQIVLSLLGFKFDIPWKTYSDYMGYVPRYDAYKEYKEGWDLYMGGRKPMESVERFEKAVALDSSFINAYLMIGLVFYDFGFLAEGDSMVEFLNDIRNDFTLQERKLIIWFKTMLHNDLTGYLQVCREITEFDADWHWNTGWGAVRLNRLSEAVEWFSQIDPDNSFSSMWEGYWIIHEVTLHMLGRHEDELQVVNEHRQRFQESLYALVEEITAHMALGNLQKAMELKKDIYVPMEVMNPGQGLIRLAKEFAVHGYEKEAQESIEEAIQWFRGRPESERRAHQVNLFDALDISVFSLGTEESLQQTVEQEKQEIQLTSNRDERIQMMRQIAQELVEEEPSNEDYQGRLGILYAQLGDRENASRIFKLLGELDKQFLHGKNIFWQAAIATRLGELSRAVTLLYDAQSKGNAFNSGFHRDLVWKPLREYPGFIEFMRPKR
jgi:tetratricopeptide (TPR) repeat protein